MQYICLSISTLIDLDNETGERIVDETKLEDSFKFTTLNFEYRDVIKTLKEGPNTRGKQRKIFDVITGEVMDVYGLIMKSLEDNPPLMELSLDELKTGIDILTENSVEKVDKKRIKDGLNQLQNIINEKETIFQVFEWKENMLYILDPLFLFYLRWGVH